MDTKDLERLDRGTNPASVSTGIQSNNNPNEKPFIVAKIDGLADQIAEWMDKLSDIAGDSHQQIVISKAWNKITRWQAHELRDLKEAFAKTAL